jgi:hypothetical protein
VYLKNAPQIQMWTNPLGSGGLFNKAASRAGQHRAPVPRRQAVLEEHLRARLEIESLRQPLDVQIVERAVLTAARGF